MRGCWPCVRVVRPPPLRPNAADNTLNPKPSTINPEPGTEGEEEEEEEGKGG